MQREPNLAGAPTPRREPNLAGAPTPRREPNLAGAPTRQRGPAGIDLDGIERDLADVEIALGRLDTGTYGTDEVTGAPLPDELLAEHPAARRSTGPG